jgi:hypothetical protein
VSRCALQLQRLHGNRFVQRALALAARGTGEQNVVPDIESKIEQQPGRSESSGRMQPVTAPGIQRQDDDGTGDQQDGTATDQSTMVIVEDFVPEEPDEKPDEGLEIQRIGDFPEQNPSEMVAAPQAFLDAGRTGTARYGDAEEPAFASYPHAFTDGGRTGTVVWGGGAGAGSRGNEGAGSIQSQTPPSYLSQMNGPTAEAWIQAGTGVVNVTRSWVGINSGNQGNGHFVTAAAATRINQHETLHVANSRGHYNAFIQPMLDRVTRYTPAPAGGGQKTSAPAQPAAITALQHIIDWAKAISDFQSHDTTDNHPMGTVDTNDLASGSYPVDAGPGAVGGVNFQHRVRTPGEPNPA